MGCGDVAGQVAQCAVPARVIFKIFSGAWAAAMASLDKYSPLSCPRPNATKNPSKGGLDGQRTELRSGYFPLTLKVKTVGPRVSAYSPGASGDSGVSLNEDCPYRATFSGKPVFVVVSL